MASQNNKKYLYERILNLDNLENTPIAQLKWFTTAANCLIMFTILTSLLSHFAGINLNDFYGTVLFSLECIIYVIMIGLSIGFIIIDYKNKIFKHRFIAPLFVTFWLVFCLVMTLTAMKTTVFIEDEDGIKLDIDYRIFLYAYVPITIFATTISMVGFNNYLGRLWKKKRHLYNQVNNNTNQNNENK